MILKINPTILTVRVYRAQVHSRLAQDPSHTPRIPASGPTPSGVSPLGKISLYTPTGLHPLLCAPLRSRQDTVYPTCVILLCPVEVFVLNSIAMLTKANNSDVTFQPGSQHQKRLRTGASSYKDVFMLVEKKRNGNKSTHVANESQIYSTVHLNSKIRSSTKINLKADS